MEIPDCLQLARLYRCPLQYIPFLLYWRTATSCSASVRASTGARMEGVCEWGICSPHYR